MKTTRREFFYGGLALASMPIAASAGFATSAQVGNNENRLWYVQEAKRWLEALPIGNGRIGGMVWGGAEKERISLSESTAWSGAPAASDVNPEGLAHLQEMRELFFNGKYDEGRELCQKYLLGHSTSFGTNLPLFDLALDFNQQGPASGYRRELSLGDAIARVSYQTGPHRITREIFASNPDNLLVVHLESDAPGQINLQAMFGNISIPGKATTADNSTLIFKGNAYESLHSNGKQGATVECHIRALSTGGNVAAKENQLEIKSANAVTLLVAVATDFGGDDPAKSCVQALAVASRKTYAELKQRHLSDYQPLMRRVQIDLGGSTAAANTSTDQRRKAVENGASDPALSALYFQYARYLTIAGSRANSPLPMALQGIWNDGLASSMGWTDDFHLDINTQQNYWLAEVGNLSESQTPLFTLIEGLSKSGRKTARDLYGAPGWVSHTVTNPWGYTAPGWGLGWGIFVTSGIWIALQMWEHYRFTGDTQFLRERAYPVFKSAADFFLAYMVEHPKHEWLVTGPSDSPENAFRTPSGTVCSESMGPTVDRVLVDSLFNICLESQKLLAVDADLSGKIEAAQSKLPPFQIGRYGQLQEWLEDFEEAEPNHRHTSHLIALYPEHQISIDKTPKLAQAARVTLERRIHQPNWEDTEWSRANLVNYYARLRDAEEAHKHYVGLISKATEDNLLTYSRGGIAGAEQNIFVIDGNTAGAAGLAEMLLQSQEGDIHLLPALPSAWPEGNVSGLRARGGFEVSMRWRGGRLLSAMITSRQARECKVRYGSKFISKRIAAGQPMRLTQNSFETAHDMA